MSAGTDHPSLVPPSRHRPAFGRQHSVYRVNPAESHLVAWLVLASFMVPNDFNLPLAGGLTVMRVCLLAAFVPTIFVLVRKLRERGFILVLSDIVVLLMAVWIMAVMVVHAGPKALVSVSGITGIEFAVAYFVARTFFGTPAGLSQFARVLRIVVPCLILLALIDTASGTNIVGKVASSIFPRNVSTDGITASPTAYRLGLVRARGAIEHPILFGTLMLTAGILFYAAIENLSVRVQLMAMCFFGICLSLSSAPFLGLAIFLALLAINDTFDRRSWRYALMLALALYVIALVAIFVDDPIRTLINSLTFDPQTGLFRMLIWEWVGLNLQHAPWIGLGNDDWLRAEDMSGSIDSLWLVQSIRYGYPAAALLALSLLTPGIALPLVARRRYPSREISAARFGTAAILVIMAFLAVTVHFWGSAWIMLAMVLGIAAGLTESLMLTPEMRADRLIHQPSFSWRRFSGS